MLIGSDPLSLFHGERHPLEMEPDEIRDFLTHLAVKGRVSASTQNQAFSALLFLYREVLKQDLPWIDQFERAKHPQKLPLVLSANRAGMQISKGCMGIWLAEHSCVEESLG